MTISFATKSSFTLITKKQNWHAPAECPTAPCCCRTAEYITGIYPHLITPFECAGVCLASLECRVVHFRCRSAMHFSYCMIEPIFSFRNQFIFMHFHWRVCVLQWWKVLLLMNRYFQIGGVQFVLENNMVGYRKFR